MSNAKRDRLLSETDQTRWHLKPAGHKGPCPTCGCGASRLQATHRAVVDESGNKNWEKIFNVAFGTDWTVETYGTSGWKGKK